MRDYGLEKKSAQGKKSKRFIVFISLGAVLLLAGLWLGVALIHHRHRQKSTAIKLEAKKKSDKQVVVPAITEDAPVPMVAGQHSIAEPEFDFYHLLPEIQVPIVQNSQQSTTAKVIHYQYLLQVSATQNLTAARNLQARLAKMEVDSHLQSHTTRGRRWYRVLVGPFIDVVEAQDIQNKLRLQYIDGLLLKEEAPDIPLAQSKDDD